MVWADWFMAQICALTPSSARLRPGDSRKPLPDSGLAVGLTLDSMPSDYAPLRESDSLHLDVCGWMHGAYCVMQAVNYDML